MKHLYQVLPLHLAVIPQMLEFRDHRWVLSLMEGKGKEEKDININCIKVRISERENYFGKNCLLQWMRTFHGFEIIINNVNGIFIMIVVCNETGNKDDDDDDDETWRKVYRNMSPLFVIKRKWRLNNHDNQEGEEEGKRREGIKNMLIIILIRDENNDFYKRGTEIPSLHISRSSSLSGLPFQHPFLVTLIPSLSPSLPFGKNIPPLVSIIFPSERTKISTDPITVQTFLWLPFT